MADETRLRRFAVLIDADNTSPRIAAGLFEEVAKFGEASVRRIYGDFSSPRMKSWADILQKYAIDPYQQFAYTTGKNASDIALVIDAMDLLHSRRFDGFCLVSSDSDFTRLASRLREEGADVYGFGARKTPESFRQACRRFIYIENLVETPVAAPRRRLGRCHPEQGHRADGDGGWLGGAACAGTAPRQHRLRLRPAHLRLPQALRPGPAERRLRDRRGRGPAHAPQGKARRRACRGAPRPHAQAATQRALNDLRRSFSADSPRRDRPGRAPGPAESTGGRSPCRGAPGPRRRTAEGRGSVPWPPAPRDRSAGTPRTA